MMWQNLINNILSVELVTSSYSIVFSAFRYSICFLSGEPVFYSLYACVVVGLGDNSNEEFP